MRASSTSAASVRPLTPTHPGSLLLSGSREKNRPALLPILSQTSTHPHRPLQRKLLGLEVHDPKYRPHLAIAFYLLPTCCPSWHPRVLHRTRLSTSTSISSCIVALRHRQRLRPLKYRVWPLQHTSDFLAHHPEQPTPSPVQSRQLRKRRYSIFLDFIKSPLPPFVLPNHRLHTAL